MHTRSIVMDFISVYDAFTINMILGVLAENYRQKLNLWSLTRDRHASLCRYIQISLRKYFEVNDIYPDVLTELSALHMLYE